MNARDNEKLDRATELAAASIYSVVAAYVRVIETMIGNEMKKYEHLPKSLKCSPTGIELQDSIHNLEVKSCEAECILFSRVVELAGKEDIY